jgi:hypothetical protein
MTFFLLLIGPCLQIAISIAIRNHGQKAANAAFRQDSQFMTKKMGSKQKVAVNKVHSFAPAWATLALIIYKADIVNNAVSCDDRNSTSASSSCSR